MTEKIKFDPGFNQYVQSFTVNIGYIYGEFKRFKNFSQKQFQFQRFYATIRTILEKQIAFSLNISYIFQKAMRGKCKKQIQELF